MRFCLGGLVHKVVHQLDLKADAHGTLQQIVVQFLSDSRPLSQTCFEPGAQGRLQPSHSKPVKKKRQQRQGSEAENLEQSSLPEGWLDGEIEAGAGLIPDAVVIRSKNLKAIGSRLQIRIERLPASIGLLPILIQSL